MSWSFSQLALPQREMRKSRKSVWSSGEARQVGKNLGCQSQLEERPSLKHIFSFHFQPSHVFKEPLTNSPFHEKAGKTHKQLPLRSLHPHRFLIEMQLPQHLISSLNAVLV